MGDAERMLIHQALRFAVWAAGEGIAPVDGEPARDPEEFLTEYSAETDDEDWETLPERIIDALSPAPEAQQEPVAWMYAIEGYGPHVALEKPTPAPKVTNLRPLYTRPAEQAVKALADALRGLLQAYENAFDWTAELPPETAEAERIANEVLEALTSSKPEQSGWRPIETAPKDGTPILLFFPRRYQGKGGVSWGCFVNDDWLDSRAIRDNDATHWMPLPTPPTAGGGDE